MRVQRSFLYVRKSSPPQFGTDRTRKHAIQKMLLVPAHRGPELGERSASLRARDASLALAFPVGWLNRIIAEIASILGHRQRSDRRIKRRFHDWSSTEQAPIKRKMIVDH